MNNPAKGYFFGKLLLCLWCVLATGIPPGLKDTQKNPKKGSLGAQFFKLRFKFKIYNHFTLTERKA